MQLAPAYYPAVKHRPLCVICTATNTKGSIAILLLWLQVVNVLHRLTDMAALRPVRHTFVISLLVNTVQE